MRICVTKKDIAKARLELMDGTRFRSSCCPVAQALKRRGFMNCTVGVEVLWLEAVCGGTALAIKFGPKYTIPASAQDFIVRFDRKRAVSPITFTIEKAKC